MAKYKLLKDETKVVDGITLYRVRAAKTFGNVKKGDVGGFIESPDNLSVSNDCWVFDDACIFGNARLRGSAMLKNNAMAYGNAIIEGCSIVTDHAKVCGDAKIAGKGYIADYAIVSGTAHVGLNAQITGNAQVSGGLVDGGEITSNAKMSGGHLSGGLVRGRAKILGRCNIYRGVVEGDAIIDEAARIHGEALICDHAHVSRFASIEGTSKIGGHCQIYGRVIDSVVSGDVIVDKNATVCQATITDNTDILTFLNHDGWPFTYIKSTKKWFDSLTFHTARNRTALMTTEELLNNMHGDTSYREAVAEAEASR